MALKLKLNNSTDIVVQMREGLLEEAGKAGQFFEDSSLTPIIQIDAHLKGDKLRMILFHELFHAILHLTGVSQLFTGEQGVAVEEAVAHSIMRHLYPALPAMEKLAVALEKEAGKR